MSVVVITGASAGVGRAAAREFARAGCDVGLLARGRAAARSGTHRDRRQFGGTALAVEADVADAEQVDAAAARFEAQLGPIDVWVNNAMATVFAPVARHDRRRVPPSDRGDVPRLGLGNDGGAALHAAARPGRDRPGRLRARLPRHPASGRLLRRQARDAGLPRIAARRADARRLERARDDGAAARPEHAAVHLGPREAAAEAAAGAADLPARGRGRSDRLGGDASAARADGRVADGEGDRRQRRRTRARRPLPCAHRLRRPANG